MGSEMCIRDRTTVVPGSGSKQSGCTRCAELMFRSTRCWLPLYPELVRSVQATRRRAHTLTRARVHTRISECTHDQPPGYGSPPHVKYSDILEHTTNPQDTDLRVHTRHDELLYQIRGSRQPNTSYVRTAYRSRAQRWMFWFFWSTGQHLCFTMSILQPPMLFSGER